LKANNASILSSASHPPPKTPPTHASKRTDWYTGWVGGRAGGQGPPQIWVYYIHPCIIYSDERVKG